MATITLWYTFADGETVGARVDTPTPYPDALAEGLRTARAAFRDAMSTGIELTLGEPTDDPD